MAIAWPRSLVQELGDRRNIIVLGAGASAGSVGEGDLQPPLWRRFLKDAIQRLISDEDVKKIAEELLAKDRLLDCAEVLKAACNDADYAGYVRDALSKPRFKPSSIHEVVLKLDPKIVVTMNYDEIYDHYCREGAARDGYNVCKYYENHALNDLRSPLRVILKAHGCVSNPDKMILSRSEYFDARREYPSFYNVLDGLFLTNTVLFIGCSLTDPDLQLILENVNLSAHSSHPHYAVIESGIPEAIRSSFKRTYNIELLEYECGHHEQVTEALLELLNLVMEHRQLSS